MAGPSRLYRCRVPRSSSIKDGPWSTCAPNPAGSSAAKCAPWAGRGTVGCWPLGSPPASRWSTAGRRSCFPKSSGVTWTTINMLQAIVTWSIRNRLVVVVLAGLLLTAGLYASRQAKLDVFPEFTPPQVVVQTEAPGLSAAEVEQLVTLPIELAVNGISRLDVLRSQSIQGLSVVTVIFLDGTDVYRARQQVAERLAELAGQLPASVKAPRLAPLTTTTGRLLTVGFTSEQLSPIQLRDRVQWTIRPRLLAVKGVAQ